MKSKEQTLLEEAYDMVQKQPQTDSKKELLLKKLVSTIAEREQALGPDSQEGIEYDALKQEVDELWSALEEMGLTTRQLNQYCQAAGVL